MNDTNKVILIGRLTRDLGSSEYDIGYLPNGTAKANFSIAVNSSKKQADGSYTDEANFFDVALFGKLVESLKPYMTKGKQIAVEGHLKQDRWQDKQMGSNRSRVYIIADNVQLLGGKSDGDSSARGGNGYSSGGYQQGFTPKNSANTTPPQEFNGNMNEFPEDIPF